MTSVRQRAFAWFNVVIAVFAAVALTVAVIVQQKITESQQASLDAQTQNAQAQAASCSDNQSEATLSAPAAYTATAPVTELQSTDIAVGTGAAAKSGDCLVVKYYGTLAKDGTLFDETYTKPSAFAFPLGQGRVIQGWDEGVAGMKVGGERRLVIPAKLAYGSQAVGNIPANSDLVFYVKLLRIQQ